MRTDAMRVAGLDLVGQSRARVQTNRRLLAETRHRIARLSCYMLWSDGSNRQPFPESA